MCSFYLLGLEHCSLLAFFAVDCLSSFSILSHNIHQKDLVCCGWLKDEYDPSEGEDKIKLPEDFQNNKLLNAMVIITEWLASLSTQVMKLSKLSHLIDDDYLMTHIPASLPQEYSSVVDHA